MVEKQYWIIDDDNIRVKLTDFFNSYIEIDDRLFEDKSHRTLTDCGFKVCSEFLLCNGVFENINDLRKQIYKEQGIIIPKI